MTGRILVVEDEPAWSNLVKNILTKRGCEVSVADNADAALQQIGKEPPDLILLDITLKGISGLTLCGMLKGDPATKALPILMLTAAKEVEDKVRGLDQGADDYLVKPFHADELAARVQALLRRVKIGPPTQNRLSCGPILVDLERHEVSIKKRLVDLRPKEFELLALLVQHKGRALKKEFLAEALWGRGPTVTSQTIAQHVKNLRAKLGSCAELLETVEALGYKLRDEPR